MGNKILLVIGALFVWVLQACGMNSRQDAAVKTSNEPITPETTNTQTDKEPVWNVVENPTTGDQDDDTMVSNNETTVSTSGWISVQVKTTDWQVINVDWASVSVSWATAASNDMETIKEFSQVYATPAGNETLKWTITLDNGVIEDVVVQTSSNHEVSEKYKELFADGIKWLVVGKKPSETDIKIVNGSSLTAGAFRKYLETLN